MFSLKLNESVDKSLCKIFSYRSTGPVLEVHHQGFYGVLEDDVTWDIVSDDMTESDQLLPFSHCKLGLIEAHTGEDLTRL